MKPTAAKETKGEGHCCQGSSRHQATGSRPGEQRTRTKQGTKAKSGLGQKKRERGKPNKITKAGFLGCPGHSGFRAGGTGNAQRAATAMLPLAGMGWELQWRLLWLCLAGTEGAGAPRACVLILQPWLLLCPQLWPRWLPWGPCPTQGPSCSSREWGLSLSSRLGPKAQEFVIETEKTKKRNQDSPTPRVGRGDGNSCSFTDEPSFPRLHQSPALLLSACSPAPRSWMPKEKESSPAAAPLHLGWHFWASQSRLQVGVHHGLTVWRLNVVGSFLELEQHGHLWGQEAAG